MIVNPLLAILGWLLLDHAHPLLDASHNLALYCHGDPLAVRPLHPGPVSLPGFPGHGVASSSVVTRAHRLSPAGSAKRAPAGGGRRSRCRFTAGSTPLSSGRSSDSSASSFNALSDSRRVWAGGVAGAEGATGLFFCFHRHTSPLRMLHGRGLIFNADRRRAPPFAPRLVRRGSDSSRLSPRMRGSLA